MPFCPKCGAKLPIISPEVQPPEKSQKSESKKQWLYNFLGLKEDSDTKNLEFRFGIDIIDNTLNRLEKDKPSTESTTKKRSTGEWIAMCCGGAILIVIIAAFISGMYHGISSSSNTGNSFSNSVMGSKTSDLKIGETAILSSEGASLAVKVINFTHPEKWIDGTPAKKNDYIVGFEIKNVGQKAITGKNVVRYWVTDWGGVEDEYNNGWVSVYGGNYRYGGYDPPPFYPGSTVTIVDYHTFSDRSLEGKLTSYFLFDSKPASWIIKE